MEREIVKFGSGVLRQKAARVDQVDDVVRQLIEDLFDSMKVVDGVGLAAPQIGVLRRVVVVDVSAQEAGHLPLALVNPQIAASSGEVVGEEGCLSLPELYGDVQRSAQIEVEAVDINNEPFTLAVDGFFARALQHEIDHLDGILFIDHISSLKRQLMRGALKRLKKEGERWDREHL